VTDLRPYLLLTLFCLVLYVPALTALPPLDRDEARFAQATKQMLETGDFIDIRFQDSPRHKKPAGAYWLQAVSVTILAGDDRAAIWAYRVPSAVAAWAAVLLTFAAGARLFDRNTALLGAAMLASSLMLVLEAHQAKTDAILLATVVAAQAVLARLYTRHWEAPLDQTPPPLHWGWAMTFWAAQGVGILVKGPITPMVSALTVIALCIVDRRVGWLRGLRPLTGLPLAAIIALPWFVAVSLVSDGDFFAGSVGHDLLPKLMSGQESHGAPPGYFTLLMVAFFWPASLFAWPAVVAAWRQWGTPGMRFALAWLVPAWLVFEAVPTKLPHYVLPLYPALALITAEAVWRAVTGGPSNLGARWSRVSYLIWGALGVVLAVGAIAVPIALGDGIAPWSLLPAALALIAGFLPPWLARQGRFFAAAGVAIIAGGAALTATLDRVMPRADAMWLSRGVAEVVRTEAPDRLDPVIAAGFHEPSLIFLLGTDTVLTDGPGAAAMLLAEAGRIAVVSSREEERFREHLGAESDRVEQVDVVSGVNYSRGRTLDLRLYWSVP